MQLSDVLCYILLTITVTASCARVEEQNKEAEESQDVKRISKRDATLIYDFDGNQNDKIFQKPKVIYRRLSKAKFESNKYGPLRYGPPSLKHWSPKSNRKPAKKGRTGKPKTIHHQSSPKYGPPEPRHKHEYYSNKKQNKYGVRKVRLNGRPGHGHVLKMPHYYFVPDKTSFGEPPAYQDQGPLKSYAYEPPIDSYGIPLKHGVVDVYPTPNSVQGTSHHDNLVDKQEQQQNYNDIENLDNNFAYTRKEPTFSNFVTLNPKDSLVDSSAPVDKPDHNKLFYKKVRPFHLKELKVVNRPWRFNKQVNSEDEIIVGGQYAEPPARHVSKKVQFSPILGDDYDDEPFPKVRNGYIDIEGAQSANQSPYSNYKNSNMAFSPQNLNDAFSIIDK